MHSRLVSGSRIGWSWNVLGVGSIAALINCAGGPAPKTAQVPPSSKLDAIVWTPCNLMPEGTERLADCARVELPRDHAGANLETVAVGIKRLRAPHQPSRGQLWFLDGGPGDSGVADLGKLEFLSKEVGDLDLYTLDPRGVGQSSPAPPSCSRTWRMAIAASSG